MKPTNYNKETCKPISSNCVIWQGPDIACIDLCKGDTITDVTNKLSTELCTLLDSLEISTYELSNIFLNNCKPDSFHALIQLLIDRIKNLEECTGCTPDCEGHSEMTVLGTGTECPDCLVSIPTRFQYTNEFGDLVTSMQLTGYVRTIGNKICEYVDSLGNTRSTVADHEVRLGVIEAEPEYEYTPPTYLPSCVSSGEIDVFSFVSLFEQAFCQLRGATGLPAEIYTSIANQSPAFNTAPQLVGSGNYTGLPGWESSPANMADSTGNLWLVVFDMYQAIKNIQLNCCPSGCDGISITIYATITGTQLKIYFTGTIPAGFAESNPSGTLFSITDSFGNNITRYISITSYLNIGGGYTLDLASTPINIVSSLNISAITTLVNNSTSTHCERYLAYTLANLSTCPTITTNPTQTTIFYNFTSTLGLKTYTVELWDNATSALIASQTHISDIVNFLNGTFTGLVANTNYKLKIVIRVDGSSIDTNCPFNIVATLPLLCIQPNGVTATFELD